MDAVEVLTTTRSVRRKLDLDRPVEPEVLTECLRIAQQAPAAGALASNFRWLVVRDPQLRARIAEPIRELGRISQEKYQHFVAGKRLSSARYLLDVAHRVPVFVLACMHGKPGESNGERSAFYGSAYPAIWSLQLALRSRGLGSTLVLYHLMGAEEQVAAILGIPDDVTQIALLAVGYTTTAEFYPARRPPIEEITYYDQWGQAGESRLAAGRL
jgi:nitroreductase